MSSREAIIWVLAVLTSVVGSVLLFMILGRWSAGRWGGWMMGARRSNDRPDPLELVETDDGESILVEVEHDDDCLPQICPRCHSRYEYGPRTCTRDKSELSRLH